MDKNKKYIIIAAIVILIGIIAYYFYSKNKSEDTQLGVTGNNTDNTTSPEVKSDVKSSVFPLVKGSKGDEVKQLQTFMLKNFGAQFPKYGIDGKLGDETIANMLKFLHTDKATKEEFLKFGMDKIKI